MKKFIILTLIAVSVLAAGCKKDTNSAQNTTETNNIANLFIVGLDDSFPPMGFRDNNNEIVGFDIDMAKEVTKRLGMEIKLQPIDWASKELELSTGKISCIWNGLSVSPAREEAMTLSKPYLANRMVIITNQNSPLNAKADLEGKKVGLQTGSTAVAALEKDPVSEKLTQVTYENNVLALTDLNIGRIDVVVMDEVVARYMISKSANLYKILNDSFDEEYYAIAFKKGNTELKDKVDALVKNGINIVKTYHAKEILSRGKLILPSMCPSRYSSGVLTSSNTDPSVFSYSAKPVLISAVLRKKLNSPIFFILTALLQSALLICIPQPDLQVFRF